MALNSPTRRRYASDVSPDFEPCSLPSERPQVDAPDETQAWPRAVRAESTSSHDAPVQARAESAMTSTLANVLFDMNELWKLSAYKQLEGWRRSGP